MVTLQMNDEEGKVLQNILENYHSHLRLEIVGTYRREFRQALKEREMFLDQIIERLEKARGAS
jgi:hypothetical protein